jgi:hypothetical protein
VNFIEFYLIALPVRIRAAFMLSEFNRSPNTGDDLAGRILSMSIWLITLRGG